MGVSDTELSAAIRLCAGFQSQYHGPNILSAGARIDEPEARQAQIDEAWEAWAGFARNYFMAMLNTLGGCKPFVLDGSIAQHCSPLEARGARAAVETFWRRDLALAGPVTRRGGAAMTPIQHRILSDETTNADVFQQVEQQMEAEIMRLLNTRRGLLRQLEPEADHFSGLREDIAYFFGSGRPARLSANQRNENYDRALF